MKFINVRELHNKTARILDIVTKGDRIVVTYRGRPCAAIIPLLEEDLEAFVLSSQPPVKRGQKPPADDGERAGIGSER